MFPVSWIAWIVCFGLIARPDVIIVSGQCQNVTIPKDPENDGSRTCPDLCTFKPDPGTRGKAPFRLWYFDITSKECKRFHYGGRGGNCNRFRLRDDCDSVCYHCVTGAEKSVSPGSICHQDPDPGQCDEIGVSPELKWHYHRGQDACKPFAYSGCKGNENKFNTEEECEKFCES